MENTTWQSWPLATTDRVALPMAPSTRVSSAVRIAPCAVADAGVIPAATRLRGTGVAGYGRVTHLGDAVAMDAFPGLTAWSPPT